MPEPKVYADFHNLDDFNRLRLTCAGTIADLDRQRVDLRGGLALTFYMDDADDQGEADELSAEGIVHYDETKCSWVASVDWSAIRHDSAEGKSKAPAPCPSVPAPTGENGPTSHAGGPLSPTAKLSR
jgi:hypothetical protein